MRRAEVRAVARLARRTARREWRRTSLVAALVAVPVMVGIVVAGIVRANELTPPEEATSRMGAADVRVQLEHHGRAQALSEQDPDVATMAGLVDGVDADRVVRFRTSSWYATGSEVLDGARVSDQPLDDPLTEGMLRVLEGRGPTAPGEIALGEEVLAHHGVAVGESVEAKGVGRLIVVGAIVDPADVNAWLAVTHPQTLDRLVAARDASLTPTWLLAGVAEPKATAQELYRAYDDATGLSDAQDAAFGAGAQPAAELGDTQEVLQAEVPAQPSIASRSDVLAARADMRSRLDEVMTPQVIATMVTAVLLAEVALIAGAAYATGARRRLRELGLLGANGATHGHVRAAVVGEATVTGVVGGAVGIVAGIAALGFGRPLVQQVVTPLITRLELSATDLLGPALVAVVAVSLAAWLPARTAARVPTTTALEGRMPLSAPKRWIGPAGIGLAGFGALLLLVGILASDDVGNLVAVIGILLAIGGTALLTVPMIAVIGRVADRFPATLRLVLRDSGRQRTRAAAASASAMVVLMVPVLVATMSLSLERQELVHGLPQADDQVFVPPNESMIARNESPAWDGPDGETVDRDDALTAVTEVLPDATLADVPILDRRVTVAPDPRFTAQRRPTETEMAVQAGELGAEVLPDEDEAFWNAWSGDGTHAALASPALVDALAVEGVAPAVEEGQLVVLGLAARDTTVTVGEREVAAVERPARVLRYGFPRVLVPPDRADDLGLRVAGTADLFVSPDPITVAEQRTIYETANGIDLRVGSAGMQNGAWVRWAAVGATLLVALVILALVTMLSATESDHDLRTMVAVGAAPRMRRRFLGLQSGVHALVGAVLAVPLAVLLARAASETAGDYVNQGVFGAVDPSTMWLDWPILAAVLVGVPAVIGVVIALLVRSAPTVPPRRLG